MHVDFWYFSNKLFTAFGHKYDITKILASQFDLNIDAYEKSIKMYLNPLFTLSISSWSLRFTAILTHVALFNDSWYTFHDSWNGI